MKALIWIVSFLVFTVLNVIFGYAAGFRVGYVLFYAIWYYSARAMCKAWDKHRIAKKAEKAGVRPFEYIKDEIPEAVLAVCEENRGRYDSLKAELKKYVKEEQITLAHADILLDAYGNASRSVPITEASAQIRFCRRCGGKLLDGSRYCRKCGSMMETISTEGTVEKADSTQLPSGAAVSAVPTQGSFDEERIMNAEDPLKVLLEEHAKETIRVMEANRTAQRDNEDDPEFGLVPEKPIYTLATDIVEGQRAYLSKLRTSNGEKITWRRLGSTSVEGVHGMIDIYETFLPSGQPYKTLYINMYGAAKSAAVPKGFCNALQDNKESYTPMQAPAKTVQTASVKANATRKVLMWMLSTLAVSCICISMYLNIMLRQQVDSMKAEISEMNDTISSQKYIIDNQNTKINSQKATINFQQTTISTLTKKAGYYDDICDELDSGDIGFAANNFKSDQSIIIVRKNEKNRKFTLTGNWRNSGTVSVDYSSRAAYVEFDSKSWYTSTTVTVVPRSVGVTVVTFKNSVNSDRFKILIIVTD